MRVCHLNIMLCSPIDYLEVFFLKGKGKFNACFESSKARLIFKNFKINLKLNLDLFEIVSKKNSKLYIND